MSDISGKIVLITAAAQGIGRASVDAFVAAGCTVIATDINAEKLKELDGVANVTTRVLNVLSTEEITKA
ncbi:MAG TPA: SDR family NAD(P)-dependent oxidoreductase, partial [Devosia sp.]|nr:SDR family NAD(P)-dependent oxidoreductase [Devosia sp.]